MYQDTALCSPFVGVASQRELNTARDASRSSHYNSGSSVTQPLGPLEQELLDGYETMNSRQHQLEHENEFLVSLHMLGLQLHHSLNAKQVVKEALYGMIGLFGADSGWIVLLNEQRTPIRWLTSDENIKIFPLQLQVALGEGIQGQSLKQGAPIWTNNSHEQDKEIQILPGNSQLVIPLSTKESVYGVITLTSEQANAFDTFHETSVTVAARTVELAIQNAWRFTQMQERDTSRESMISRLVHDIRSPLMATAAGIDVIHRVMKDLPVTEQTRTFIQESLDSGKRGIQEATTLTNDLLDIKKMQSDRQILDCETMTIELLFDEIHKLLYSIALSKKVMIRYNVSPRSLQVFADMRLLRRAIINLAANALRFTPEGGTVSILAYPSQEKEGVIIAVEDMGPGVNPADRERIFDPFVQAKGQERRGSGLGLAFCREVTIAHGGRIWVEDREGSGSRFAMLYPNKKVSSNKTSPKKG